MSQPYAVEVTPDLALQFTITRDPTADPEGSRCVMTIRHPGLTNQHLAFKVRACGLCRDIFILFVAALIIEPR